MNKEYIEKLLKELNIIEGEYYVIGSAAMVIRGIRQTVSDLDLCISEKAFEELKTRYNVYKSVRCKGAYQINDEIEFFVNKKEDFKMEYAHGYPLEDIHVLLDFKLKRNAEKDKQNIIKIQKYLETNKD